MTPRPPTRPPEMPIWPDADEERRHKRNRWDTTLLDQALGSNTPEEQVDARRAVARQALKNNWSSEQLHEMLSMLGIE